MNAPFYRRRAEWRAEKDAKAAKRQRRRIGREQRLVRLLVDCGAKPRK